MKPALLLTIAALVAALGQADVSRSNNGHGVMFKHVAPHDLARDELLARSIACEDMLCLERELDDKLIHSAVRPITRIVTPKKQVDEEDKAEKSCCAETPCYFNQCMNTCNHWQVHGGATPCGGPCGYNSYIVGGNGGYSGGGFKDGSVSGGDDDSIFSPPAYTVAPPANSMAPPVYSGGPPTYTAGNEEGEAQERKFGRYAQTVRKKVLRLTRSCKRKRRSDAIDCMQKNLDSVLERQAAGCCLEDSKYFCMCRNTCFHWQHSPHTAPKGLILGPDPRLAST